MNKYAAEKIASEYYNLGVQFALQNSGLGMSKTASRGKAIAKALGIGGGAALSPAAINELGMLAGKGGLGGATGIMEAAAIRNLLQGEGGQALAALRSLPGAASMDAANIYNATGRGLNAAGEGIMGGLRSAGGAMSDAGGAIAGYLRSLQGAPASADMPEVLNLITSRLPPVL
jgi:hypothetical protein